MKVVTVREAQHNLAEILREVEAGKVVEIQRRKSPVARIVPLKYEAGRRRPLVDWADHKDLMAAVWKDASLDRVQDVLDDLRGDR
jgi:prevent-host-death family protein